MDLAALLDRCDFPDGSLALGVSGGADSVAMALLAQTAGREITIWHVDHGLRPSSSMDADMVDALASRLGVAFELRQIAVDSGTNMEARARAVRYEALPANICVGHTADDRAETVLFNLLRGAGPAGVAAPMARVNRPILRLRRAETEAVCDDAGITPIVDEHNVDPSFTRVRVRNELLPLIADLFDRDPVPLLNRHADLVGDALAVVQEQASQLDATDAKALAAAPKAVASEALRAWLRHDLPESTSPDAASIDRVLQVAGGTHVATEIEGGHRISRSGGRLSLNAFDRDPVETDGER